MTGRAVFLEYGLYDFGFLSLVYAECRFFEKFTGDLRGQKLCDLSNFVLVVMGKSCLSTTTT
jgi:hypothetical protein